MNREQMIEMALKTLEDAPFGATLRDDATDLIDRILPQVTTPEDLTPLAEGSLLVRDGVILNWRPRVRTLRFHPFGQDFEPDEVLAHGPLTVVWQP